MKIEINYPINGCDLQLKFEGDVHGLSRDEHNIEVYGIVAKFKGIEVFRYDGEEHGLLANSELSEEITLLVESFLVEQKFEHDGYFSIDNEADQ